MKLEFFLIAAFAFAFLCGLVFKYRTSNARSLSGPKTLKLDSNYAFGLGFPEMDKLAAETFLPLAEKGDVEACAAIGWMYIRGIHFDRNLSEASKWYQIAAEKDHPFAMNMMSYLYASGDVVPKNDNLAVQMCQKAAALGQLEAQKNLGDMILGGGNGFEKDIALAAEWYVKAAEGGFADAQCSLAILYCESEGLTQNYSEAEHWFRMAADQGNAVAQYNLGVMYSNGRGVSQDDAEALRWFRIAADQGDAEAQYTLGSRTSLGQGIPQDDSEAVRWFQLAADQGHANAQYILAGMNHDGQGVPQNYAEAYKWYALSAAQGNAGAVINCDLVLGEMTPAQIAEGQRLAAAWRPH